MYVRMYENYKNKKYSFGVMSPSLQKAVFTHTHACIERIERIERMHAHKDMRAEYMHTSRLRNLGKTLERSALRKIYSQSLSASCLQVHCLFCAKQHNS
jgi:hypothetical protein